MGPASAKKDVLLEMIKAGVNICRLNFSHGKAQDHKAIIDTIREINAVHKTNVGILADLQGPKIRIGLVKDGGNTPRKRYPHHHDDSRMHRRR